MLMFPIRFFDADGADGNGPSVPTITVSYNGTEVEVPRPKGLLSQAEIDKSYIPKATHDDLFAKQRRKLDDMKGFKNPAELLDDPEFRTQAQEKWGLNPNQTAQQLQDQVNKAKLEVTERQLKPLQKQLETESAKVKKLLTKQLEGQIVSAAAEAGIDPLLLKAANKGGTPMIVSMLRDSFDFDPELDAHFAKGPNGFAYSTSGETPYQTPLEFITNWANGDGKAFVKSQRQSGSADGQDLKNQGSSAPGVVGRELRMTHSQIRDISYFKQQSEFAAKNGLTIVPVPDA